MEATGETCKLCLKYIQGPSLAVLDENLLSKLEFLQMDLDQSVEESNSVCKECEEKIESAFDFKSCIVPSGSEEQTQKGTNDPSTSTGESSAEKAICHLCKNSVNATAVISLPKVLKDDSMMEVFQGHIPEMDLEGIENKMVCDACQKSLASFSTLIASWSIANGWNDDEDMKEDFDDFEMVQVKKEGFDELSDSNTNSSMGNNEVGRGAKSLKKTKSKNGQATVVKIKTEGDGLSDSCESASVNEKDIKKEPEGGAEMEDLQLKSEEVDIKPEDEDGICEETNTSDEENLNFQVEHNITQNEYLTCKKNMKAESCDYINTEGVTMHKCQYCKFETTKKSYLRRHAIKHKRHENPDELIMFKCEHCNYETNRKDSLIKHFWIHKTKDEMKMYKCEHCPYKTCRKGNLHPHLLIHKDKNEVPLFKCSHCSHKSKYKFAMKAHELRHEGLNNVDETVMLKCEHCAYETCRKKSLNSHRMIHKNKDEAELFKCEGCSYKTKYKYELKRHKLTHKNLEEMNTFNCQYCSYRTLDKALLKSHIVVHKNIDEVQAFKCNDCTFITKYRTTLKRHKLTHKSLDEVTLFKCYQCSYSTIYKPYLKEHVVIHSTNRAKLKCPQCSYTTLTKSRLRIHKRTHKV